LSVWFHAARPKTLPAGSAPVIVGTALAFDAGMLHLPSALCALAGSLLIQIGTNLANDYFDHAKGADAPGRLGPVRATQAGLISPRAMLRATAAVFLLACLPGLYIVWRGGWPFIAVGLLSILCGVLYTAGPYPLGYLGLGDLFVLVFFGPVAVGGTYYVQAHALDGGVLLAGLACGLMSVAILTVNNLRDIEQDRFARKMTLAVRFGRTFARAEYATALAVSLFAIPAALGARHPFVLLSMLAALQAAPTLKTVLTTTDGPALNDALASTGRVLLVFSILFSIGWIL
jgi:1,4-dihydroxy-2-naphthoate octaprenyltransferase